MKEKINKVFMKQPKMKKRCRLMKKADRDRIKEHVRKNCKSLKKLEIVRKRKEEKKENILHRRFIQEYFKDLNAAQAYIRAGGSRNGAAQSAHNLMQHPEIASEIKLRLEESEFNPAKIINMLQDRASVTPEYFFDLTPRGFKFNLKKARASGKLHLIRKVKTHERGGIKEFELADPDPSLEKLAKILKLYSDAPPPPSSTPWPALEKLLQTQISDQSDKDGTQSERDSKGK